MWANIEEDLGEIEPVTGNASQIREALTNLILNAADAIPDAGTISFRSRVEGNHDSLVKTPRPPGAMGR